MQRTIVFLAALLAVPPLAGCLGLGGAEEKGNQAPDARLAASSESAWAAEPITFDASESKDPDGNITSYRFDFGDGTVLNVPGDKEPEAEHAYSSGGEYVATLTVVDDGAEQGGALTDTATLPVAINENVTVEPQVVFAGPQGNTTASGRYARGFDVRDGADLIEVNLTVESALLLGSSEVRVRLLGADGSEIASDTVTVSAGGTEQVELEGAPTDAGEHVLEVNATTGGASVEGAIRVLYDE